MSESRLSASGPAPVKPADDLEALRRNEQAGTRVMAARNSLRKGDREGAKRLIKEAFQISPADLGALEMLGDMYLEEAETERAAALYERALLLYPGHASFEEKLALCHLDLAEMENDKLAKQLLLSDGPLGVKQDRSPSQAVTLSLLLPGAGQFYNDENEKGAVYLAGALLSCLGWFYPLWTALSNLPGGSMISGNMPNLGAAYANLGGIWLMLFWVGLLVWLGVYGLSVYDAWQSVTAHNRDQRQRLGL